ncbi:MAG: hypothetical protein Q9M45_02110, partial [Robiginitomaculum sp.]|nr:hypothetical protein [Robiginitomaculum sp.]
MGLLLCEWGITMSDQASWRSSIISCRAFSEMVPMGTVLRPVRHTVLAVFLAITGLVIPAAPVNATEFLVNTITALDQQVPSVAALTGGGFVVAWEDLSLTAPDTSFNAVRAQRYDANGVAQGSDFLVNTITSSSQFQPSVAALNDGGFVIAYGDNSQLTLDTTQAAILATRFDAVGVRQGSEFLVNTTTASTQLTPSVAALSDGGFVIAWRDDSLSPQGAVVRAQRYDASGGPQGSEFLVSTATAASQVEPSVAGLTGGGFIIAWRDDNGDGNGKTVRAQRYDANGLVQGGKFQVNTTITNDQYQPSVAALSNGNFVIAWRDDSLAAPDTDSSAVRARIYNAGGTA